MIKTEKINRKKKFKKIWSWLLEKIETDEERVLRIARKKNRTIKNYWWLIKYEYRGKLMDEKEKKDEKTKTNSVWDWLLEMYEDET